MRLGHNLLFKYEFLINLKEFLFEYLIDIFHIKFLFSEVGRPSKYILNVK